MRVKEHAHSAMKFLLKKDTLFLRHWAKRDFIFAKQRKLPMRNEHCIHGDLWYACKKCMDEQDDPMWKEYDKLKEELEIERSKRKQIEELYDNLKADVAPLIKAAKELNESYEDAYAVNKVRRAVKYL
jgi:hypothetical protein